jgi:hypothetical protein
MTAVFGWTPNEPDLVDLFNFGAFTPTVANTAVPWPSPVALEPADETLLAAARRVVFGGELAATRSECARRLASATAGDDDVFAAWSALDVDDGDAIARLVAANRMPSAAQISAAIARDAVAQRVVLVAQLVHELRLESDLLHELRTLDNISVMYAIRCGAFSCIDALLDLGAGFTPGALHVELMPCIRSCSRSQVLRMMVNSNVNLLQLEEAFLFTRQFGGAEGPFPFLLMRSLLEDAYCFDQSYRRNQLFSVLERVCADSAVPVVDDGGELVAFVRCLRRLPRSCRARIVQFAVAVPPPERDTRRWVVARDWGHTWMRGRVVDERPEERGGRELFIKFDNWDATFNEWIPAHSDRLVPWVHPRERALVEAAEFEPNEEQVRQWLRRLE